MMVMAVGNVLVLIVIGYIDDWDTFRIPNRISIGPIPYWVPLIVASWLPGLALWIYGVFRTRHLLRATRFASA